jgi:pyridoxamine 5'-phosphate oxidase
MKEDLHDNRKTYAKKTLLREDLDENPIQQFQKWFYDTKNDNSIDEANAMTVSSIGEDGFPKTRVVLLKYYDEYGFVFYTNYESEKGKALSTNPKTCLNFFWPSLERQIVIKGKAEKLSEVKSDQYFTSRPKGSQIGALVSPQSQVISGRKFLEDRLAALEKEYANKEIDRPKNWGGFLVRPESIEFWQGRPNRLHDRFLYSLINQYDWKIDRLAP